MLKAKKTVYVITTARAITFDGGFSTSIRSFSPDHLTNLRRKQRSDGSGDLIFERKQSYHRNGSRRTSDHGFLAIPDVKTVENLVRQLVEKSGNAKQSSLM